MSSVTQADLIAYRAYAEKNSADILSKLNFGFKLGEFCTQHADVLGRINLTEMTFGALSKRYSETFQASADVIGLGTRHLDVEDIKIDLKFVPKAFERTYAAYLMRTGQTPSDFPLLAFIIPQLIAKNNEEREIAGWQGVKTVTPAANDPLIDCIDGFHKIIVDETANISVAVTGAITSSNAVASLETVYEAVGSAYQGIALDVHMSTKGGIRLLQDYRERYGKYTRDEHGKPQLDIGTGMDNFIFSPGQQENSILITPRANKHYGFANPNDSESFSLENEDRNLKLWMDYKIAFEFGMVGDLIAVNDQHS